MKFCCSSFNMGPAEIFGMEGLLVCKPAMGPKKSHVDGKPFLPQPVVR